MPRRIVILAMVLAAGATMLGVSACCGTFHPNIYNLGTPSNGLRMDILAPETYWMERPFNILVSFQNVSDHKIALANYVPWYDLTFYTIEIKDRETGKAIEWQDRGRVYTLHTIQPYDLDPGETYELIIKLHEGTFSPPLHDGQVITIKCTYNLKKSDLYDWLEEMKHPWKGTLTSNTITTRILEADVRK